MKRRTSPEPEERSAKRRLEPEEEASSEALSVLLEIGDILASAQPPASPESPPSEADLSGQTPDAESLKKLASSHGQMLRRLTVPSFDCSPEELVRALTPCANLEELVLCGDAPFNGAATCSPTADLSCGVVSSILDSFPRLRRLRCAIKAPGNRRLPTRLGVALELCCIVPATFSVTAEQEAARCERAALSPVAALHIGATGPPPDAFASNLAKNRGLGALTVVSGYQEEKWASAVWAALRNGCKAREVSLRPFPGGSVNDCVFPDTLSTLRLTASGFSAAKAQLLFQRAALGSLTALDVSDAMESPTAYVAAEALRALPTLTALTDLTVTLDDYPKKGQDMKEITRIAGRSVAAAPALRRLRLGYLKGPVTHILFGLKAHPTLEEVNIRDCGFITDTDASVLVSVILCNKALKLLTLRLHEEEFTVSGAGFLSGPLASQSRLMLGVAWGHFLKPDVKQLLLRTGRRMLLDVSRENE